MFSVIYVNTVGFIFSNTSCVILSFHPCHPTPDGDSMNSSQMASNVTNIMTIRFGNHCSSVSQVMLSVNEK